jgi:Lipase maturation factor
MGDASNYWLARFLFQRGLGVVYFIAFLTAINQFLPLAGEHGLTPVPAFVQRIPFRASPSLFYLFPRDAAFMAAAWIGLALSCLAVVGISDRYSGWFSALVWSLLWLLYISFVNVGQTWYGFGWETMLLEAGFFAIFLGSGGTPVRAIPLWILRWMEFRVMFGAGLIKLRGDSCWRDLTCLNYFYETQPIPNPLSWYFHWAPEWVHKSGVMANHIVELIVPFGLFLPQPIASVAALTIIAFQLSLMLSGNLSFLNLLTIVIAIPALDARLLAWIPVHVPSLPQPARATGYIMIALGVAAGLLSIQPVLNMISPNQFMNASFNRLHLVNTYGAFGSITKERYEIVVEGTLDALPTEASQWREYEFKGKPGDVMRPPPQIAPYHLRLDWLMWFAAMGSYERYPWFVNFTAKLLEGDRRVLALLRKNPFPDRPPRNVRSLLYGYRFTTPEEHAQTGAWWKRELQGTWLPPLALDNPRFRQLLQDQGLAVTSRRWDRPKGMPHFSISATAAKVFAPARTRGGVPPPVFRETRGLLKDREDGTARGWNVPGRHRR